MGIWILCPVLGHPSPGLNSELYKGAGTPRALGDTEAGVVEGSIIGDGTVLPTGAPSQGPSNHGSPGMRMGLPEGLPTHPSCTPPLSGFNLVREGRQRLFAYFPANDIEIAKGHSWPARCLLFSRGKVTDPGPQGQSWGLSRGPPVPGWRQLGLVRRKAPPTPSSSSSAGLRTSTKG